MILPVIDGSNPFCRLLEGFRVNIRARVLRVVGVKGFVKDIKPEEDATDIDIIERMNVIRFKLVAPNDESK